MSSKTRVLGTGSQRFVAYWKRSGGRRGVLRSKKKKGVNSQSLGKWSGPHVRSRACVVRRGEETKNYPFVRWVSKIGAGIPGAPQRVWREEGDFKRSSTNAGDLGQHHRQNGRKSGEVGMKTLLRSIEKSAGAGKSCQRTSLTEA